MIEEVMIFRRGEWIEPEHLDLRTVRAEDVVEHGQAEHDGAPAANDELSWLQREALRIASQRREVQRGELMRRFGISREVAHRCLTALVGRGLLCRIGLGRGARYVPLAFWLAWIGDAVEWALTLV